jgi:pseudouridine-5'-phosphate glycosidase
VIGYQCDELPAFYSRRSALPIDVRADLPEQVAHIFRTQQALGISSALLVTVPVPEQFEVPAEQLETILNDALSQAEHNNITGRELTPYLLAHMAQCSDGATLRANIALLENNARVAAEIASSLAYS